MSYPLVRDLTADGIPVTVMCRVLKIARQPYYRWLAAPVTAAELNEAYRANALFDAHHDDPEFGYRFLVEEARDAGEVMAERTAWRGLLRQRMVERIREEARQERQTARTCVHEDLCAVTDDTGRVWHEFKAAAANELWVGDITEHWTVPRQEHGRDFSV